MKTAFIGLGRMGAPMARNLLAAGHALRVFDVDPKAAKPLVEAGAQGAESPAVAAGDADVVLSCVPGPAEVAAVMEGETGVLAVARPGLLVIETSTIGPAQSRALAAQFAALGADYVDAPLNRLGTDSVADGELTIMVGGTEAAFERARPILEHLGREILHVGPSGAGNAVKLLNQMIYLSYVSVFCEGLALGEALGLDRAELLDIFETSAAGHRMIIDEHPKITAGDETPGFAIDRVLKDLELAEAVRAEVDQPAPAFAASLDGYRKASAAGEGASDMTALRRLLLEKGGENQP